MNGDDGSGARDTLACLSRAVELNFLPQESQGLSSTGAAASGQPARMGKYLLANEIHNNYPVYKKEDKSQVMFVNNKKEWAVFHTIDPNVRSLRNKGGLTATPPRDGWQFWNRDSGR